MSIDLLTQYKAELTAIQTAKTALLTNGQEHSLNGSHSFKGIPYKELCRRETQLTNAIAALNGASSIVIPDFS